MADHLSQDGGIDPHFAQTMHRNLGPAFSTAIQELPRERATRRSTLRTLPENARPYVREMARTHTPLKRYVFRNTRDLLRKYITSGLLEASIPWRDPRICRIHFRRDEAELYDRITEYISEFYQKYESERRGLGFIMTVYRRRLTSSFYAMRCSLERRRDALRGLLDPDEMLTPEDEAEVDELGELETVEMELFEPALMTPGQKEHFQKELEYLDSFIAELSALSQADSKLTYLKDQLEKIFRKRPTVMVFTQYTDTMDYLREQLCTVYGSGVACYSGRGGEVWNGLTWLQVPKERVKNDFRSGEIKILLCTESASEGLNLQTCGVLINYDMPWNPMRVEQRIGRIDRIGQVYERVWISNYFYRDSIEDRIYQALKDRIHWFEDVVGDLQPILAAVGEMTRKLVMMTAEEQPSEFEREIKKLRANIDEARLQALNITEYLDPAQPDTRVFTPVTLADLETLLTGTDATSRLFQCHSEIPDAYVVSHGSEQVAVTFSADRFDEFPDTLQLLSYGNPLLDEILDGVPAPDADAYPAHVRRYSDNEKLPVCGWYDLSGTGPTEIAALKELKEILVKTADQVPLVEETTESARQEFAQQVEMLNRDYQSRLDQHSAHYRATLVAKARRLLEKAALMEICLGQQQMLFSTETYPTSFDEGAVTGLSRHKTPWSWMLVIGGKPIPRPQKEDLFFKRIWNEKPETLKGRFTGLTVDAKTVLEAWQAANQK